MSVFGKLPKAITFDIFGTVIDWEGEIEQYFRGFLAEKGISGVDPKTVQLTWEELQFDYIQGEYRPYRQVLKDTLAIVCQAFGFTFTDADAEAFSNSMESWKPFPDSVAAIKEIRKYTKFVPLSNTDSDILEKCLGRAGIEMDGYVTAEMARCYKPNTAGFDLSRQLLGLSVDEMMHAGFGFKYDVVPANKLGYRTVWVNRQGIVRPVDDREDMMCGDLQTLALILKGMYLEDQEAMAQAGK